jgi:hypothetical protein
LVGLAPKSLPQSTFFSGEEKKEKTKSTLALDTLTQIEAVRDFPLRDIPIDWKLPSIRRVILRECTMA